MITIINYERKIDFLLGRLSGGGRLAGEPFYVAASKFDKARANLVVPKFSVQLKLASSLPVSTPLLL
jgi:hypothetical protein